MSWNGAISTSEGKRWRVVLFGRAGRWWPTREQAERSAIKRKLASRDEHSDQVYLSPGVTIEQDPPPEWVRRLSAPKSR